MVIMRAFVSQGFASMRAYFIACCWLVVFVASARADMPKRPNVVVILADDLGYSDLGCYGGEIATPNLNSLAEGGLRYTQFYNTSRCWPTRAALLTGYYAQQVGFDGLPNIPGSRQRPVWAPLLPTYLKPLGYRSYHAGKWHLDGGPVAAGFDRSYSLNDQDRFFSPEKHTLDDQPLSPIDRKTGYYATTEIANRAIEFLQQHKAEHSEEPFFEYVAFTSPHFPLHAPPEDIARYQEKYLAGWDQIRNERWARIEQKLRIPGQLSDLEPAVGPSHAFERYHQQLGPREVYKETPWAELTPEQQAFQASKMAVHAAMVDRMDQEIGRVIDQLKRMGVLENTVIFFCADNGASAEIMIRGDGYDPQAAPGSADAFLCLGPGFSRAANTPFRRHKMWTHEGGISTPLIVHWPAGIADRGVVRHAVGHMIDFVPTIVELAGGQVPTECVGQPRPALPGKSLVSTFKEDINPARDYLWWFHQRNRALRVGDWKIVSPGGAPWELYNLAEDRPENHDLSAENGQRVEEMARLWKQVTNQFVKLAKDGQK